MKKKFIGIILAGILLYLPGCGAGKIPIQSFTRENTDLSLIQNIAVMPFEGGGRAKRIRELTITQLLATHMFDVVDKGRVDNILRQEAIAPMAPLDTFTIRRFGETLNVEAILLGSVEQVGQSRGNAVFTEITMTLRLIETETGQLLWQASGRGSGYSLADRLFGFAPKDSFELTLKLLNELFATMR